MWSVAVLRAGAVWLALAVPGSNPSAASDALGTARELFATGKWQQVVETLQEHLRFAVADPDTDDLLGQALFKLGRKDEAAHHFDRALGSIAEDDKRVPALRKRLSDADPLTARRDGLFRKISRDLAQCAEQLEKAGHRERALEMLERVRPIASGSERIKIAALCDRIRSATEAVDLDQASGERPADGWPAIEHESERYEFTAKLEPEVAELLGRTMDEIFEYYVKIYFDGDERKVSDRKARIFIHSSHADLMTAWEGPKDFVPGGWWSPGEWVVHAYDTRPDHGSLDEMLVTLFHEASHHFMTMLAKGGGTTYWLNEGTASFFEGASAMADGTVLWPDAATDRLRGLKAMLDGRGAEGGKLPTMRGVIRSDAGYPAEHYPWGWGLVYFLQQYEDPQTLEYVYRPLYIAYRDEIIQKGGDPEELFAEVFTGPKSPLKHASLDEFERDWRAWIAETIYPLHTGSDRRERRTAAIERYLQAAKAAAKDKKAKVSESELLQRALGHIEFVRTKIDAAAEPDAELLSLQADVLEKLGRGGTAAPLIEQLLDLANEGKIELDEARYAQLEERLAKLDLKNAPLRLARSRAKNLSRTARQLFDDYRVAKVAMPLRSYTFATLAAAALDDQEQLGPAAAELRVSTREAGLLRGATFRLAGNEGAWKTIFTNQESAWEHASDRIVIEGVRPVGQLCTEVPISGEYELRARITRVGEARMGAHHGLVVSGTAGGDWMVVTIDHSGRLFLKRMLLSSGGGVTDTPVTSVPVQHALPIDQPIELSVHVFPEGHIAVTVDGEGPYPFRLPLALPAIGHAGVYVKYGRNLIQDAVIEILP